MQYIIDKIDEVQTVFEWNIFSRDSKRNKSYYVDIQVILIRCRLCISRNGK